MARGGIKVQLLTTPGGVREDVNIAQVPEGAWLASSNFLARQGQGQPRPGYLTALDGGFFYGPVLGFGFSGDPLEYNNLWIAFARTFITVVEGLSVAQGPAPVTDFGDRDNPIRFATFSNATRSIAVAVSPLMDVTLFYITDPGTGPEGTFESPVSDLGARDICVTNNRVVLVHTFDVDGEHPYQVRWSDFSDPRTWPTGSSNTAELADTAGEIIGCAALGPLSMAIYKTDSLWVGQGVIAKNPFQFQMIESISGPMSAASIITYRGAHYWLARDGCVYRFDGTQVQLVGSGLSITLRNDLFKPLAGRVHGAVLQNPEPELWWWYPSTALNTLQEAAVTLNLVTGAMTRHVFLEEITASSSWIDQSLLTIDGLDAVSSTITGLDATYATIDSMSSEIVSSVILGHDSDDPNAAGVSTVARVSQFGIGAVDNVDAGVGAVEVAIPWSLTHGWKQPVPGSRFTIDGIHAYWHRESSSVPVTVAVTVSDSLGEAENSDSRVFDLALDENHYVPFRDLRGQYVKAAFSGSLATTTMRHRGGLLTCWPRGFV